MNQIHPYDADRAYHFINMALAAEAQPTWEADEPEHPDLENLFALPRQYYDHLFRASAVSAATLYDDIHEYVQSHYELLGAIRVGADALLDYETVEREIDLSEIDSLKRMWGLVETYSEQLNEVLIDQLRYHLDRLVMGYVLRAKEDGHGVLALRGTMSVQEWLNNFNYQFVPFHPGEPDYGSIHNGFRDVYKGIRGRYRELVDAFAPDTPLYFVGHSLGAAVSQIAALDIALEFPERADHIQVYAFASPRTGDPTFAAAYDRTVGTSYRIVNVCDIVPYILSEKLGDFVGIEVHPCADTKGERAFVHQAGNPIANHISSYHLATRLHIPTEIDLSQPRKLAIASAADDSRG